MSEDRCPTCRMPLRFDPTRRRLEPDLTKEMMAAAERAFNEAPDLPRSTRVQLAVEAAIKEARA